MHTRFVTMGKSRGSILAIFSIFLVSMLASVILRGHPDYEQTLEEFMEPVQVTGKLWQLCFRASENSYNVSAFHAACDNKGPTVTLVRVGDNVFGGYTNQSWNGDVGES